MLTFPSNVEIFLADKPIDFRRGFDGLSAIIHGQFGMEPMDGNLFVFLNRRRNQVRLFFWDRNGLCILSKRLEQGTFRRVKRSIDAAEHVEIDTAELAMLLEGIDMDNAKRRKRYVRPQETANKSVV